MALTDTRVGVATAVALRKEGEDAGEIPVAQWITIFVASLGRPNVYRLSRAVPTHDSGTRGEARLPEPAPPAGQRTAPRRLVPVVGRSRAYDMGDVTTRLADASARDDTYTVLSWRRKQQAGEPMAHCTEQKKRCEAYRAEAEESCGVDCRR